MTSKERANLTSLAHDLDPIFYIGKASLTPQFTQGIIDAFQTRELMKIGIQKNCCEDALTLANTLAERTHSQVVRVLGSKIILYKKNDELHKPPQTHDTTDQKPKRRSYVATDYKPYQRANGSLDRKPYQQTNDSSDRKPYRRSRDI
jgi:RNA-binding protein